MPVKNCRVDGKPGQKWGDAGKCYPYEPGNEESKKRARERALKQGLAIGDIEAKMRSSNVMLGARGELFIEDTPLSELEILETGVINERPVAPVREMKAGERLGTILERKRLEMNMSIMQLAEKLPIRVGPYARIESGFNSRPPDDILEAIADVLELDADMLKEVANKDFKEPVEGGHMTLEMEYEMQ